MGWIITLIWILGMPGHGQVFGKTEFPEGMPQRGQDIAVIIATLIWPVVMVVAFLMLLHAIVDARITKWRKT